VLLNQSVAQDFYRLVCFKFSQIGNSNQTTLHCIGVAHAGNKESSTASSAVKSKKMFSVPATGIVQQPGKNRGYASLRAI
jgi:hypothetical protein